MPTKEEAEAMADAILAAHSRPARAQAPTREGAAGSRLVLIAGFCAGALVAALPSHNWIAGGLIGLAFAAVAGAIARRL